LPTDITDTKEEEGGFWSKLGSMFGSSSSSSGGGSSSNGSGSGEDVFKQSQAFLNQTAAKVDSIATGSWKALHDGSGDVEKMQGVVTCYPADGEEVVQAVIGNDCTVSRRRKRRRKKKKGGGGGEGEGEGGGRRGAPLNNHPRDHIYVLYKLYLAS